MTGQPAARRRQTDARWLIDAGLLLIAVSNYWMSRMNLNISPDQVIWPRTGLVFFRLLSTRAIPAGEVWINDKMALRPQYGSRLGCKRGLLSSSRN